MESLYKALYTIRIVFGPLCGRKCLFCCIKLNEEGAQKVADLPTSVAQDAILDHMGSDFRLSLIHISEPTRLLSIAVAGWGV